MRSRRTPIIVIVVIVVLLAGFFVVKARGSGPKKDTVDTTTATTPNCPPVARADVAGTKPAEAVAVDVLANDTDADGDPLVFQILKTTGGTATVDDGGTPTDSSDDRLLFTPNDPAPTTGVVEYQALDPQGGFGSATLTVSVNPEAALPAGASSEAATDGRGRCGAGVSETTTSTTPVDTGVGPVGPDTAVITPTTSSPGNSSATTRRTGTTRKTNKKTTTTAKRSTTTTGRSATTTTSPGTTAPPNTTTTTTPPSGPTTTAKPQFPECDAYPKDGQAYHDCLTARSQGKPYPPTTTTTTRPR